jgi:ABC-type Fe3+ transport system permease subunit
VYAAADQQPNVSGPVLAIVLLSAGVIYLLGYLRAVMHRANRDYKTTKAAVKPLRKGFWRAWWAAVRIGAIVVVGLILMIGWVAHDARRADSNSEPPPSPSPSVTVRRTG